MATAVHSAKVAAKAVRCFTAMLALCVSLPGLAAADPVMEGNDIARQLAKEGCTVLCFDFRGTGRSRGVEPEFWDDANNRQMVRGYKADEPPDESHPYGHEKVENVAAGIEGMLILVGAGIIIYEPVRRLIDHAENRI